MRKYDDEVFFSADSLRDFMEFPVAFDAAHIVTGGRLVVTQWPSDGREIDVCYDGYRGVQISIGELGYEFDLDEEGSKHNRLSRRGIVQKLVNDIVTAMDSEDFWD